MVEMIIGGSAIALVVDSIIGEEEVIIRPLLPAAGAPASFEGMAVLSGGRPVPVVSLPRLTPHQEVPIPDASVLASLSAPIHVLLVDDSRITREMLRRLLEDAGFIVTGVGSADEAMLVVDREHIDCLLTDIEMPGMDGLDLTRRLRQDSDHTDLPIVVVSTLDRPGDRLAGLESGANAYLTKQGLDAQELVALIHRVGGRG
jgi:CheY-like chemotaxis protein